MTFCHTGEGHSVVSRSGQAGKRFMVEACYAAEEKGWLHVKAFKTKEPEADDRESVREGGEVWKGGGKVAWEKRERPGSNPKKCYFRLTSREQGTRKFAAKRT